MEQSGGAGQVLQHEGDQVPAGQVRVSSAGQEQDPGGGGALPQGPPLPGRRQAHVHGRAPSPGSAYTKFIYYIR